MTFYADLYDWSDVTPIPQDDGREALVQISYSESYKDATALLRAVMAAKPHGEKSVRVEALTRELIMQNPSHYVYWDWRLRTLQAVGADAVPRKDWLVQGRPDAGAVPPEGVVVEDYTWLNMLTPRISKNYQVWHYRQCLKPSPAAATAATTDNSSSAGPHDWQAAYFRGERQVVLEILALDAKNYHAWAHLSWLVLNAPATLRPSLEDEVAVVDGLLEKDVYNNSAWAYRSFIFRAHAEKEEVEGEEAKEEVEQARRRREFEYVQAALEKAPENESAWNYLISLSKPPPQLPALAAITAEDLLQVAQRYLGCSPFALELAADLCADKGDTGQAKGMYEGLLGMAGMREGYWRYKLAQLENVQAVEAAASLG